MSCETVFVLMVVCLASSYASHGGCDKAMKDKETDDVKTSGNESNPAVGESEELRAIRESIAEATHELNNYLTGLLGQSQLLRRGELNPAMQRRVDVIEQLAVRIKDSVTKIRDL